MWARGNIVQEKPLEEPHRGSGGGYAVADIIDPNHARMN